MELKYLIRWTTLTTLFVLVASSNDVPKVEPFNFQRRYPVGHKAIATCTSLSPKSLSFTWLKNGKELTQSSEIRIKNDKEYSVIIIDPIEVHSQGNYTCVVSNDFGKDSFTAELLVEGK
ncbi:neurotrimin-like [Centruroides vittatus]|uniref:neurotrimin-like n=1 Tax=Centruroides vittatus TaxID=120091 RepID=UPI00350ED3F2